MQNKQFFFFFNLIGLICELNAATKQGLVPAFLLKCIKEAGAKYAVEAAECMTINE